MKMKYKKRKDGRYQLPYTLPDGTKKYLYGRTEEELKLKLAEVQKEIVLGLVVGDNTTVSEWAAMWFDAKKKDKVSEARQHSYRNDINNHIHPSLGNYRLKDIKPIHVQNMINKLSDKSKSLQNDILICLRQIFDYAVENGLMQINVAKNVKPGGIPTPEKAALTDEEQKELLDVIKGTRVELFVMLCLYCGLRRSEALALQWSDIDFEAGSLRVSKSLEYTSNQPKEKAPKSKAGNRTVPIPDSFLSELKSQRGIGNVVTNANGKQCSEMAFKRLWEIVLNKLQKPLKKDEEKPKTIAEKNANLKFQITPHKLRHTYATMLYYAGIDLKTAQVILGHANISVTAEIYTHLDNSHVTSTKEKLNSYFTNENSQIVNN